MSDFYNMIIPELHSYMEARIGERSLVDESRKLTLLKIRTKMTSSWADGQFANLLWVCTHNSRRSHLAQFWCAAFAHRHKLKLASQGLAAASVSSYSGGTEATAVYKSTLAALEQAGAKLTALSNEKNSVFSMKFDSNAEPALLFSKRFDHPVNPASGVIAIMTCAHADQHCPAIPDALARISLPYVDPKVSDNSLEEEATYDERCAEIAREMAFLFDF